MKTNPILIAIAIVLLCAASVAAAKPKQGTVGVAAMMFETN